MTKSTHMRKWEKQLGTSFPEKTWQNTFNIMYSASHCVTHWELFQKSIHQWYLTPLKLAKFYPTKKALCWRDCGESGSLYHISWICKLLRSFWNKVFCIVFNITGTLIDPNPALALLHLGIHDLLPNLRPVLIYLFLAAKLIIKKLWNSNQAPSVTDTIATLNHQCKI